MLYGYYFVSGIQDYIDHANINKINNTLVFKIKDEYKLEFKNVSSNEIIWQHKNEWMNE